MVCMIVTSMTIGIMNTLFLLFASMLPPTMRDLWGHGDVVRLCVREN